MPLARAAVWVEPYIDPDGAHRGGVTEAGADAATHVAYLGGSGADAA